MPANAIPFSAEIESVRGSLPSNVAEDFRTLAEGLVNAIAVINPNALRQNAVGVSPSQTVPAGVSFSVSGGNGSLTLTANDGSQNGRQVWKEFSYSTVKTFSQAVTILPLTTANSVTVNDPGATYFFRVRVSFDQVNWSGYQLASVAAVGAGLVSSSATAPGAAFNQTNFGVVDSTAEGSTAVISISGPNGAPTALPAQKGTVTTLLPAEVISNVPAGSTQFVGWTGSDYVLRPTLASVLSDDLTPIGRVSVVEVGVPELPTVSLILGDSSVVGWNVTDQGNGLTAPVTLAIVTGTGAGATPGTQTIVNGKLISIAPGNPGAGYMAGDTVTVTGGVGSGAPGGGTAAGGNGGRMTAV